MIERISIYVLFVTKRNDEILNGTHKWIECGIKSSEKIIIMVRAYRSLRIAMENCNLYQSNVNHKMWTCVHVITSGFNVQCSSVLSSSQTENVFL